MRPLALCVFLCVVLVDSIGWAGGYEDSVHADPSNGVYREDLGNLGYARGNCAHCHEMHSSLTGLEPSPASGSPSPFSLFAPNYSASPAHPYSEADNFCFYCHNDTGSAQQVTNEDFSKVFGCSTAPNGVLSILDAFNQRSYHNLSDIRQFILTNNLDFPWYYEDSNPCDACHNPHLVRRNLQYPADPAKSVLSKPSDHFNLLGVSSLERMSRYPYTAPYCSGTSREPAGQGQGDGSDMPDYVGYCTACHNLAYTISSSNPDLGARNLYQIDWSSSGDKHGARNADNGVDIEAPYSSTGGYVLSCMDCHEPHGAPNLALIRRRVNGGDLYGEITAFDTNAWGYLCTRCHKDDADAGIGDHYKWKYIHHESPDAPYPNPKQCCQCHGSDGGMGGGGGMGGKPPINCNNCHFHGGTDAWAGGNKITF